MHMQKVIKMAVDCTPHAIVNSNTIDHTKRGNSIFDEKCKERCIFIAKKGRGGERAETRSKIYPIMKHLYRALRICFSMGS